MSDKNMDARTAVCSLCGPTKINHNGRCRNAVNLDKTKSRRARGAQKQLRGNQSHNKEYIRKLKDVPCMDCGIKYPYYVMDLDHRDPSTKHKSVAQMMRYPKGLLIIEAAKCDVVCSNCHRERTWGKKKRPLKQPD